ncbi:MAG: DUF6541 family protein [Candidatus Nanopelagicales bacterium]
MEALQAVVAVVLALALALGPGMIALRALRPGSGWVRDAAVAPALSLALLWVVATGLGLLHLPASALTVLPLAFGLPLLALLLRRRRGLGAVVSTALRVGRWDVGALVLGFATAVVLWASVSQLLRLGVPNDDGAHHGFYTTRILVTSGLDPQQVLVGDIITGTPTYDFYPLALHLMAAMIAATGIPVAVALNATWITLSALGLGFGMYVLTRRTFPGAHRAAIAAAVLAPVMPQLPVGQMYWGGAPLIVGMSLVPGVADTAVGMVRDAVTDRQRLAVGAALGLAATGIFFAHTTELITAGILALCLAFGSRLERPAFLEALRRPRTALALLGAAAVVFALALAPYLPRLVGGVGERTGFEPLPARGLGSALVALSAYLVGPAGALPVLGVLALAGLVVGIRRGWMGGWLWYAGVIVAIALPLAFLWPGIIALTTPWYRIFDRVGYNLVYPGVALVSLGAWWIGRTLRDRLGPAPGMSPRAGRAVTTAVVLVVVGLVPAYVVLATSHDRAQGDFTGIDETLSGGSLAGPDARAAFAWLADHTEPGQRVLNEFADGSAWMYAEERVLPLFGAKVAAFPGQWDDREYLLAHAAEWRTDPTVRELMQKWDVRYAYLGGRLFPGHDPSSDPALTVDDLVAGGWTIVFQQGDATVLAPPTSP